MLQVAKDTTVEWSGEEQRHRGRRSVDGRGMVQIFTLHQQKTVNIFSWATIMLLQPWHISICITGAPSQHVTAELCKGQNITSKCILL